MKRKRRSRGNNLRKCRSDHLLKLSASKINGDFCHN